MFYSESGVSECEHCLVVGGGGALQTSLIVHKLQWDKLRVDEYGNMQGC